MGPLALRVGAALALLLVLLKLAHLALAGVFMDEAYYWMWGQHPALSYYDHPPLNAWLLGLSSALFGWNRFALHLPVALGVFADIAALYLLSRRIAGRDWPGYFVVTVLLFLTTPIFWMVSASAIPDHVLLPCSLLSIAFFYGFFRARALGEPGASRDLYLGALCLGLAGLAKYNAAFLAVGVALFVLLFDRRLLREGRLYLAAALTLVLQVPVIVWNATERFASWEFILHGRHAGLRASYDGFVGFAFGILLLISPFLFWPIAKFAASRKNAVPGWGFARTTFWVSSLAILALSFGTLVLFHWNILAYAAMLPFLAAFMRPRWLLPLQVLYGTAFAIAAFVNYSIMPLTDVQGWRDEATAWSYGWSDVAAAVTRARADHDAGFVATADYTTASLLGFYTHDPAITSLSPHTEQYDYWFDAAAHAGEDAILYDDRWRPLSGAETHFFASVTKLASFPVVVHGRKVDERNIYLATDFDPNG